jgi:HSP20 family molecular chaperone IbpA
VGKITAKYKDGILDLTLPKEEQQMPVSRQVGYMESDITAAVEAGR